MTRLLLLLGLLLLPVTVDAACTGASPTWTCTGELATLAALFQSNSPGTVLDGDTINVTAGTWVWNGNLTIGGNQSVPGFTLAGAGEGVTIFQRGPSHPGCSSCGLLRVNILPSSSLTRLTAFTIDAAGFNSPDFGMITLYGSGLDKFRVDHVTADNVKNRAFGVYGNVSATGNAEFTGLFDHDTCNTSGTSQTQCYKVQGSWYSANDNQWLFPFTLGSNHATYVEDSVCNAIGTFQAVCTDMYAGSSYVFRYNTSNIGMGSHGSDSAKRGAKLMEAYRNVFIAPTASTAIMNWRSGPNLIFDNTATNGGGKSYSGIAISIYRTMNPGGGGGKCDGTSSWDGNLGSGTPSPNGTAPIGNPGWPCVDQDGWLSPNTSAAGSSMVYNPAYIWHNSISGVSTSVGNNNTSTTYSTNYSVADRDYFTGGIAAQTTASSPFDGTTGVGFGTLDKRPTTCTTGDLNGDTGTNSGLGGVGYWATDQGSWNASTTDAAFVPSGVAGEDGILYKCTATDTWTAFYTPYTYPHPLQGVVPAVPDAPTTLRAMAVTGGNHVCLVWTASALSGLAGYHIYHGLTTGVYDLIATIPINSTGTRHKLDTEYCYKSPVGGVHYFTVTAYSATVADSAAATEVSATFTTLNRSAAQ